jgi:hypothetical protein
MFVHELIAGIPSVPENDACFLGQSLPTDPARITSHYSLRNRAKWVKPNSMGQFVGGNTRAERFDNPVP